MCSLVGVDLDHADTTFLPRRIRDLFLGWTGLLHFRHLQQQAVHPYRDHCGYVNQLLCTPGRGVLVRWGAVRILKDARHQGTMTHTLQVQCIRLNPSHPIVAGPSTRGDAYHAQGVYRTTLVRTTFPDREI